MINSRLWNFFGIIVLVVPALISSCSSVDTRTLLVASENSIQLHTNWRYNSRYSGTFRETKSDESIIYSGDPNTQLAVTFFTESGQVIRSIPLNNALSFLGEINSLTPYTSKSVFAIEEHGDRYVLIDSVGELTYSGSIGDMVCANDDLYELNGYSNGVSFIDKRLVLETDWVSKCSPLDNQPETDIEAIHRNYFRQSTSKCKVAILSLSDSVESAAFGACNILPHLVDTPRCTIGGVKRFTANGKLFCSSPFSDLIQELNIKDLSPIREFSVTTSLGKVGIHPPPISADDISSDGMNTRFACESAIAGFAFNAPTNQYFVTVYHEVASDTPRELTGSARSWSLLVLDESFNAVQEFTCKGGEYVPEYLLQLPSGVWIMEKPSSGIKAMRAPKTFKRIVLL